MRLLLFVAVFRFAFRFSMSWVNALLILCPVLGFSLSLTSVHPRERLSLLSESSTFNSSALFAFLRVSGLKSDL